jgi:hypothetical protein
VIKEDMSCLAAAYLEMIRTCPIFTNECLQSQMPCAPLCLHMTHGGKTTAMHGPAKDIHHIS